MKLTSMLKGIGGEFEIVRSAGAFGVIAYVLTGCGIAWYEAVWHDKWDAVAFCAAFSGGFVAIIGSVAGAVAVKDRNVAKAKIDDPTIAPPPEGQG